MDSDRPIPVPNPIGTSFMPVLHKASECRSDKGDCVSSELEARLGGVAAAAAAAATGRKRPTR